MTQVSLGAALTGLKAAQKALDTISTNIANASTPGYTRKILPQEALLVAGQGVGVRLQAVYRTVDQYLVRDLARQTSVSSAAATRNDYLNALQQFHGASDQQRSMSADISRLGAAFTNLSAAPDNPVYLSDVVSTAQSTAQRINDYARTLNDLRSQAESEISAAVSDVNNILKRVAELNIQIAGLNSQGKSTADLEDQRDAAVRAISQYIQTSSFVTDNNKIVLMTRQGQVLADEQARSIIFTANTVTPGAYYPNTLSGISIENGGGSIDIQPQNIGGSIGELMRLRDETLPVYQAQIDEFAQKMAERFDAQGLRLFTDSAGQVPLSTTPPAPVTYVGFANQIRVNEDILADPTLLRSGTYGGAIPAGSNEIVQKIVKYAFGPYAYQQANGTADISAGTVFAASGMTATARLIGNMDLNDYVPDLDAAPNITAPANFNLTIGATPYVITINPGDTAADLVNTINTAVGSTVAALNGLGQLMLNTTDSITLGAGTLGAAGLADLGFTAGVTAATNPSFTVQVGGQSPVTVTIGPADTAATLLATLNAIPGLSAALGSGGELVLQPTRGGDLQLLNTNGTPLQALGMTVSSVAQPAFRETQLGPSGTLSTGLLSNSGIEDYIRGLISAQATDASTAKAAAADEQTYYETLDRRNSDYSGVDLDQELSELIRIQTAYSAAARMITATERTFDELLAAFAPV